jgi:hypothetical protein
MGSQGFDDVLGGPALEFSQGLLAVEGHMRGDDHLVTGEQRIAVIRWLTA